MRGLTAAEARSEQLQVLTSVGLLADDVTLATMRYPNCTSRDFLAISRLSDILAPETPQGTRRPVIPYRKSMTDPVALVHQAAALVHPSTPSSSTVELDLTTPLKHVLQITATNEEVSLIRGVAEVLAQVTLNLAENLSTEKGSDDWTQQATTFSTV